MNVPRTPIVAPLGASDHLPLVGRSAELAELEQLLDGTDGARLVFVRAKAESGRPDSSVSWRRARVPVGGTSPTVVRIRSRRGHRTRSSPMPGFRS